MLNFIDKFSQVSRYSIDKFSQISRYSIDKFRQISRYSINKFRQISRYSINKFSQISRISNANTEIEIGEDFLKKLKNIKKYYHQTPEIDFTRFKIFKDELDFLTLEDIEILTYGYKLKHPCNPNYNLRNIKIIEDKCAFAKLQKYLDGFKRLPKGEDIKLILKIKKGEPTHYGPSYGVHVIPIYLRHEEDGKLSIFIIDQSAGLICEKREGFVNMISIIEAYATKYFSENYRLIKSSAIIQSEPRNCPIYALSALHYFVKKGHQLFSEITPFLVPQNEKVCDQDNNKIYHLRADGLPAPLVKLTNRTTLDRVNKAYAHPWMPFKIQLSASYAANQQDLIQQVLDKPVGKQQQKTLRTYLTLHGERCTGSAGNRYIDNTAVKRKMEKARDIIPWILRVSGVIKQDKENQWHVDNQELIPLFKKIRA